MFLNKDTVQIQFTKRRIGRQILHFCHTVVGEIDLLKKKQHMVNNSHKSHINVHLTKEILQLNSQSVVKNLLFGKVHCHSRAVNAL